MGFDTIHVHECINSLRREREKSDYYTTRHKAESNTRTLRDTESVSQLVKKKERSHICKAGTEHI